MPTSDTELSDESARASSLLFGKILTRVIRYRETEVQIEFADGSSAPRKVEIKATDPKTGSFGSARKVQRFSAPPFSQFVVAGAPESLTIHPTPCSA